MKFLQRSLASGALIITTLLLGCNGYDQRVQNKERLKKTLETRVSQIQTDPLEQKRYAILINGDFSSLHKYNISHAYETLRDELGFEQEDIFVLSSNYPRTDESINNPLLVTARGTKENLHLVVDYIATIVDDDDLVVLYGTGHGERKDEQSWIALDGPDVSAREYEVMLEKINPKTIVSIMDQCYSGGFAQELSDAKTRVIAIASTDEEHTTYCAYFSQAFWRAFANPKADLNGDATVSVQEAYKSALSKHKEELSHRKEETNGQYVCSSGKNDVSLR